MACCYIIYSVKINKFYIGASHEAFDARMLSHLNSKYGSQHFTSQVNDWEPFLVIDVNDYSQAIRLERKIKGMKSRTYISNLKKYPELLQKIILKNKKSPAFDKIQNNKDLASADFATF